LLDACSVSSREAYEAGPGNIVSLQTSHGIQYARVFGENDKETNEYLVVVLHGDAPNGPPSYQYTFAEELANHIPGSIVAALLRPGYSDASGLRSAGRRGLTYGDNYTPAQLTAITEAIKELRNQYSVGKVFLVGHSGGAAITANIMGLEPDLAHTSVLLCCPCDLGLWREHMHNEFGGLFWRFPVRSISPLTVVEYISDSARIRLIIGADDNITPPKFSQIYADELSRLGLDFDLTLLPDRGHEILNDKESFIQIRTFFGMESYRDY
jgi:predicted esterase